MLGCATATALGGRTTPLLHGGQRGIESKDFERLVSVLDIAEGTLRLKVLKGKHCHRQGYELSNGHSKCGQFANWRSVRERELPAVLMAKWQNYSNIKGQKRRKGTRTNVEEVRSEAPLRLIRRGFRYLSSLLRLVGDFQLRIQTKHPAL